MFFRNPTVNSWGFGLANLILVGIIYERVDDPLQFFFIAGGLVTFSFFLKRAIQQVTGA